MTATAYLEFPGLEAFLDEVKRRGLGTVGFVEVSRRREVFEECLFRLTAFDRSEGIVLRCDLPYYNGFQLDERSPKEWIEKHRQAREKLEAEIRQQLKALNVRVVEAEFHP